VIACRRNIAAKYAFFSLAKYDMRDVSDIIVAHVGRPHFLAVKRPKSSRIFRTKRISKES